MSGVVYFNFDIDIHNIQRTENVLTTLNQDLLSLENVLSLFKTPLTNSNQAFKHGLSIWNQNTSFFLLNYVQCQN